MKIFFIMVCGIVFCLSYTKAQNSEIRNEIRNGYAFSCKTERTSIYTHNCNDTATNNIIFQTFRTNSKINENIFGSDKRNFVCFSMNDTFISQQIVNKLPDYKKRIEKICFIHCLSNSKNVFVYYVFMFTVKNYNKYIEKGRKMKIGQGHERIKIINEVKLSNYAKGYFIINKEDLFKVNAMW